MSKKLIRAVYQKVRTGVDGKTEIISEEGPFDFYSQQRRRFAIFKQQPWFNRNGEFLGFGDLDINDIKTVATSIEDGEWFIVCGNFPKDHLRIAIRSPEKHERLDLIGRFCEVVIYCNSILIVEGSALESIPYQGFLRRYNVQWSGLRRQDIYHWLMIENHVASLGSDSLEDLEVEINRD